jgi:hypothetical protein
MPLQPIASLIAGILILIFSRILNYVVAIYLIDIGVMGLAGCRCLKLDVRYYGMWDVSEERRESHISFPTSHILFFST